MTITYTQDGTCLITHPDLGTISARTREEAESEIRRRKEDKEIAA